MSRRCQKDVKKMSKGCQRGVKWMWKGCQRDGKEMVKGWQVTSSQKSAVLKLSILRRRRKAGRRKDFHHLVFQKKIEQVAQGQYVVSDTRCPALSDCELE